MHSVTHQTDRTNRADAFLTAVARLESVTRLLESMLQRVSTIEDRLDRQRRPYGDGSRH
jgi:hypothetical protein